jgi:hypothetical protein
MSQFGYTRSTVVFDGTSANSSNRTSNPLLVTDAQQISASWITAVAVASNLTVQGSNDDGMSQGAATQIWSTVSVVAGAGIFTITPGLRWVRFIRPAVDSQSSVMLNYRVY